MTILKNKLSELLTDTELPSIFIPQQVIELLPNMLLVKLQQSGCIKDITVRPLKWEKSKSLLAYFVDVANDKLNLKKGQKRQIKPFETLFNVLGLTDCINEYQNKTGQPPQGYKDIDNLFT